MTCTTTTTTAWTDDEELGDDEEREEDGEDRRMAIDETENSIGEERKTQTVLVIHSVLIN